MWKITVKKENCYFLVIGQALGIPEGHPNVNQIHSVASKKLKFSLKTSNIYFMYLLCYGQITKLCPQNNILQ